MKNFQTFKDRKGEWRWRLRARNGKIVASAGEGFKRKPTFTQVKWKLLGALANAVQP